MKAVIYARVSSLTDRQNTERQVKALSNYATQMEYEVVRVFEEHISGGKRNEERPVFMEMLNYSKMESVDIILFDELSRCGRSTWQVLEAIKFLLDNGINALFKKEGLYLFDEKGNQSPVTAVIITCLSMAAEMERQNIYHRLNSGRELAKQKGVKMGRKVGSILSREEKQEKYRKVIQLLRKGMSVANVLKICKADGIKIGERTIWSIKKEFSTNDRKKSFEILP